MLQNIRDKIQGWISGVVATLIALTFILWGTQYLRGSKDAEVAKVNGVSITKEQLKSAYEQAKRSDMMRLGRSFSLDQKAQAQLRKDVLQRLIEQQIIYHAETKMGFVISHSQLWQFITSWPIFQVNGKFSIATYHDLVRRLFYSEASFIENLESTFLRSQLELGVAKSGFVLPNEIDLVKRIYRQERDFSYFVLPFSHFVKQAHVSEEAIKKYYDESSKEFSLPEMISIQYLELSSSELMAKHKTTDSDLRKFYHDNANLFSTPKRWQIMQINLPINDKITAKQAKEKIEALALSLKDKQDLSGLDGSFTVNTIWVSSDDHSSEMLSKVNGLAEGEILPPNANNDGYGLIKLLKIEQPKLKPYQEVLGKLKEIYQRRKLTQLFNEASDRLTDLVYTNPDSLDHAASDLGLKIKTTELFTSSGGKNGILASTKVVKASFSDPVLRQHYNSNLIEVDPGKVAVLRVKDHIPEKVKPLSEVRSGILAKLSYQQGEELAKEAADKVLLELKSGKSQGEIARQYGGGWRKLSGIKSDSKVVDTNLIHTAFSLFHGDKQISASQVKLDDGYAVVYLDKIHQGNNSGNNPALVSSLPKLMGYFDYQNLIAVLIKSAKVKILQKDESETSALDG